MSVDAKSTTTTSSDPALRRSLDIVKRARHALALWCAAIPEEEEHVSRDTADGLQVTARAISEELQAVEEQQAVEELAGFDLMYAGRLVGMAEIALWNFLGSDDEVGPSTDSLRGTMDMACARLDAIATKAGQAGASA